MQSLRESERSAKSSRLGQCALTLTLAMAVVGGLATVAQAGPYSPGRGGAGEAGFIDAGIAGFVGPAGEGVAATSTNGNIVNPIFTGWATGYVNYLPFGTISANFIDPTKTLGPVTGNNFDIASLGDMNATQIANWLADPQNQPGPGEITLTFDVPIANGSGADFAVFENGFVSNYTTSEGSAAGQMFAELGFVEVSTDGVHFARFPSVYLNDPAIGAYLTQDVSNIYNLAGKHANAYATSFGTPFNLDDLIDHPLVLAGLVDLMAINYVKIVDIPGNGTFTDSLGNGIYDSWVTWGSGGLDLEAVGVINQALALAPVPEPASLMALAMGALALTATRRRQPATPRR